MNTIKYINTKGKIIINGELVNVDLQLASVEGNKGYEFTIFRKGKIFAIIPLVEIKNLLKN